MTVYILIDPRDGLVRYVGKSESLRIRYHQHFHKGTKAKRAWVKELSDLGLKPLLLEMPDKLSEAEYIFHFVRKGHPLLNAAARGGWGKLRKSVSEAFQDGSVDIGGIGDSELLAAGLHRTQQK